MEFDPLRSLFAFAFSEAQQERDETLTNCGERKLLNDANEAAQTRTVVERLFDTVEEHGDMIAAFGNGARTACSPAALLLA